MRVPRSSDDFPAACEDCGARIATGRTGCQKLFEDVLATEFGDYRYGRLHRLTVDTYSLQHPERYMRSGKSFAAHLTGMAAALEADESVNQALQRWLNGPRRIDAPDPPSPGQRGKLTITHVHGASDPEEHLRRVRQWARSTWEAWSAHHDLARLWIRQATMPHSGGEEPE